MKQMFDKRPYPKNENSDATTEELKGTTEEEIGNIIYGDENDYNQSDTVDCIADEPVQSSDDIEEAHVFNQQRMQLLLQSNREKDDRLTKLEYELNHQKVQHREGIYWLQLQLDTARREKDAAEERMSEFQADLRHILRQQAPHQKLETEISSDKRELEGKVKKYEATVEILENQMAMIKTSSGEVIKTLKEEIADLMEDRSRMEVDLLNQLSSLDKEKSLAELDYEIQLKMKDEVIEWLRSQCSLKMSASFELEDLEDEIDVLRLSKQQAEDERVKSNEVIHRLEEEKVLLEGKLEAATNDLAVLRNAPNSENASKVLDTISKEREAVDLFITRVATIWELADASILSLEGAIDQLRPKEDAIICGDSERMLSTLESASLVHGQIKVSLLLIELKLRNQLQCLKNDKLTLGCAAPSDKEITKTMEEIQKDALTALAQVETALTYQLRQLKENALQQTIVAKSVLQDRIDKFEQMQQEYKELEEEVARLKTSNQDSDCFTRETSSRDEKTSENFRPENQQIAVSGSVINHLQIETIRIVERVQAKNNMIVALKKELEEHKKREHNLRKELKRALRANNNAHSYGRDAVNAPKTPNKSSKQEIYHHQRRSLQNTTSPFHSPTKTPVKTFNATPPLTEVGSSPASAESLIQTPTSGIRPLQPSPREITKPRCSPPFIKSLAFSPIKSPTGVVDTEP